MRLTRARVSAANPNYVWRFLSLMLVASPMPAWAACTTGTNIVCSGLGLGSNVNTSASGVTTTVEAGAIVSGPTLSLGTRPAVNMVGSNVTLNNLGTIDPSLLLGIGLGATGATLGNTGNAGSVVVNNNAGGNIRGSGIDVLGVVTAVNGVALNLVGNGASTITVNNSGLIEPGLGLLSDRYTSPVIAAYGGAPVNFTNNATGVINGRVGFGTSAAGNRFYNAGTILGSVNMGANSSNQFTAVTGSTVGQGGLAVGVDLGIASLNLNFARLGIIDGGANGNNTLVLQNGANSGATGTGTASADVYKNFSNLTVNSGTWTTAGSTALLTGTTTQTTLNGGLLNVHSSTVLGTGQIVANGGALGVAGTGTTATLSNGITLGQGGLALTGDNNLTLSGAIVGGGGLSKSGAGTLTLNGSNAYTGGTVLSGGTLSLGTAGALGTGVLKVEGSAALTSSAATLTNAVALNANLSVNNTGAFAMSGPISGAGMLTKTGAGLLTLAAGNTYGGGTVVNGGGLVVGGNGALGTGLLTVGAASSLSAAADTTLTNNILLSNALTVQGANALALSGTISGGAALNKVGTGTLTLSGANSYTGGTNLGGGLVNIGSNTALGVGPVTVSAGTTVASLGGHTLANNFTLNSALTAGGSGDLALSGVLAGPGALIKSGSGTLTLNSTNTYGGGTQLNGGRVIVGANGAFSSGAITVAGSTTLDTLQGVVLNNDIGLDGTLTLGGTNNLSLGGALTGNGALVKNGSGTLTLGGINTHAITQINAGTVITSAAGLSANVLNNATLTLNQTSDATYGGSISGTGLVNVAAGSSTLVLNGTNTFTGGLNLQSGIIETRGGQALADNVAVNLGSGTQLRIIDDERFGAVTGAGSVDVGAGAAFRIGATGADNTFGGNLAGAGQLIKEGAGLLTLTGNNGHTGTTSVVGGGLKVDGSLASTQINVSAGAALSGAGTAGGVVNVADGGILSGVQGQTLTLGGLTLSENAQFNVALGAPASSPQTLVQVNGDLTLDGQLNVSDTGGFGVGVYRLIQYTGALNDNGLALGTLPSGTIASNLEIQTAIGAQVNLLVQDSPSDVLFWNGSTTTPGAIVGGSGTWASGVNNWITANAQQTQPWGGNFAVFSNAAPGGSTVTVNGAQAVTGMQFFDSGYTLGGPGSITLRQADTAIRVDPGANATINTVLTGTGGLNKRDTGTLVLGGVNTYTGGTRISEGVLEVGADTALGTGGGLAFAGGTLRVTGNGYTTTARPIDVGAGAGFDIDSATNTFTLNQALTGAGRVTKLGAGTLVLGGSNAAIGGVNLNQGTLLAGQAAALGAGSLEVGGNATLGTTSNITLGNAINIGAGNTLTLAGGSDYTLAGDIAGADGILNKIGANTVTLNGANTYTGGTTLTAGVVRVGSDTALGTGDLRVVGAARLEGAQAVTLVNDVTLSDTLTVGGSRNITLAGQISGAGTLVKNDNETLTLTAANDFAGGTLLNAGTLVVGNDQALGLGTLTAASTTLSASRDTTLANDVDVNGALTITGLSTLTLGGDITGAGSIVKNDAGTLVLTGANGYVGGTVVNAGTLVGNANSLQGAISAAAGSSVNFDQNATGTYAGALTGGGNLVKLGGGELTLSGANAFGGTGTVDVQAGTLVASGGQALTGAAGVAVGNNAQLRLDASESISQLSGTGTLNLNGAGTALALGGATDSTFNGVISGDGTLSKTGTGALTLAGANTITGATTVQQGRLNLTGQLNSGTVVVGSGATLAGSGQATGNVTIGAGGTLEIATATAGFSVGALDTAAGSTLNAYLGAAGNDALVNVAGNANLSGSLNVYDAGGFGVGVYRLFTSGGTIVNNLTLADQPAASNLSFLALTGQLNLLNQTVQHEVQFWDGANGTPGIDGGSGTWSAGGNNWVNADDNANSQWGGRYAVFEGVDAGGTALVTVQGTQNITGMQFGTDGYRLVADGSTGGALQTSAATGNTTIRVEPGVTATLAVPLAGDGTIAKTDSGTLVFETANSYTGGTRFEGGVVRITADNQLGAAGNTQALGGLTFAGGTLEYAGTADATTGRLVTLEGAGNIAVTDGNAQYTITQGVTGPGELIKSGAGTLALTADGTYQGGTQLQEGTLLLGSAGALGGGTLTAAAGTALGTTAGAPSLALSNDVTLNGDLSLVNGSDLRLDGDVTGAGGLIKSGAGDLTLAGTNDYSGNTQLQTGTINVASNNALGSGILITTGGTSLDALTGVTLQNNVQLGAGQLTVPGTADLTLAGDISGAGGLTKEGAATLTLSGTNSYGGGTTLAAGTLLVGDNAALGTGGLDAAAGTTLAASSSGIILGNAIALNGPVAIGNANDLTLNGDIDGAGGIIKTGTGTGTLTLAGDNGYAGGTDLTAGTLQVGSNTALGTGDLIARNGTTLSASTGVLLSNDVLLDGSVTVDGTENLTLTGLVADAPGSTGTLVKSGTSVLTLAGANTYSGGTTLVAGGIVVGDSAALGSGDLTVAGNGSLVASAPGVALGNDIALQAALTVSGAQPLTLTGDINGAGSLIKNDTGTLTLLGSNGYTGGTTLNGGALVGNTDSLVGAIGTATNTTVTFSQPGTGTYAGAISGAGAVVIAGGDITFTGANNYTGGTTVNSGTLTGNAGSLTGDIVDNGTVVFDQDSTDGTYTGNIIGSGSLIKTGDATLVMTGNSNVAGGTTISQGMLQVDGTLTGGPVQVTSGAQLGGTGTVTSNVALANGARLVAGTPINPISFGGDLSLSDRTEMDFTLGIPDSATTAVTVAGALTLDGVLNVTDGGGLGSGVYRLFSAQGGITDNGIVYGTLPVEMATGDVELQVSTNQANLVYQAQAGDLLFWNGAKTVPDGVIAGGSGTWNAGNTNWTDSTGSTASAWNGRFAVFSATGGTVTVEGTQAVTGLQFLDADYTLAAGAGGEISLTQASTPVRVDSGTTATISAPIIGTGGLNKADGGTLVLTGTNTYAGGTTISAGKISVSADDQLGLASGGVTLNGGTLSIADAAYASTDRNISLGTNGGGIEVVAASQVFTVSQAINGSGGLIKQGDGTLVLSGANGYTGGTQVAGGTLAGDSTSLQGAIDTASGTTLRFDQAADGTFTGSVGGAGQLVKEGTGTLTLTQPSSYTGGTSVNAGTLVGDTSSLQGTIANNSVLVFNQSADGDFMGTLAGSGQLTKEGGGTLGITGTHGFDGILDVNAGTVALGTEAAPATLPAAVQVSPGGTLAGYGTVANLNNAGTVSTSTAAGGGIRVSGNYTGAAGSTLVVALGDTAGPGLQVGGNATLDGTLRVVRTQPLTGSDTYTVVRADQGLTGVFATTELPNLAFVDAAVAYSNNDVQVNFTRNETGFEEVTQTPNQEAVAGALNGLPAGSPLASAVLGLSVDEAPDAFKQLSGDSHASLSSALMRGSETIRTTSLNHLRNSIQLSRDRLNGSGQSSGEGPAQTCQEQIRQSGSGAEQGTCTYTLWADVQGSWQRQEGDGNAPSYRQRIGGVTVGGDVEVGDGWRVGAAVGYQDSTIWQDSRNARSKSDSYSVSIYGGKSFLQSSGSALNVMAGAAYAWHDINSKRDLTLAGQSQELEADYRGNTTQIFGELGYEIPVAPQASVEPFVGAAWMKQRMGSFSEDGGVAALSGSRQSNDITTTTVGLRGRMDTEIAGAPARLSATLGWRHAMGDVDPERTMAFATGPSFTVAGTPISRNALVTEIGAEVAVSRNAAIGLSYQGQFGSGARENAGFLNVRWNF
ncbi:autotransporter-associated beta strand repeat-containing protein [Pseudomonadota bacterium AL_CKDN230030165-1A_HGKHYDSX7]